MVKSFLIAVFLIFPWSVFATGQEGDILIWKGDTLTLLATPLEVRPDIQSLKPELFSGQKAGLTTACWRGYIAEWTLHEDELYLTNIYSCTYQEDGIKADLGKIFPLEYRNGKVKATWVTGDFLIPLGKLILYEHTGFQYFYEKELELSFAKGELIHQKTHDNSKSHKSIYTQRNDELYSFIYRNINWDLVPELKGESMTTVVSVESGEFPHPDNVQLLKGTKSPSLDKEVIRVVSSLPDWSVYYKKGKPYPVKWTIPIRFNEEIRKEYAP